MESEEKITPSNYFKSDTTSVFDEISKPSTERPNPPSCIESSKADDKEHSPKPTGERLSMYFPSASSYNYIATSSPNMPLIEDVSYGQGGIGGSPEAPSLLPPEVDRTHNAWIPSEATKEALSGLALSPGTYKVDKSQLVMPGIALKEEFGDPVRNLVQTYLGEEAASQRQALTPSSVTQDDRGLRQLIAAGCYHAAVNLTTQLLTVYGQGERRTGQFSKHTAHSVQIWYTRIALLIKLRRFSLAEVECDPLGDLNTPDLYFDFYPELYGGRKGSLVPFSFRLLVAELPQFLGKHMETLNRLSKLLATCNKILQNLRVGLTEDGSETYKKGPKDEAVRVWASRRARVLYALCRCAVGLKDFRLASTLLQRLLQEQEDAAGGLFSALGRLCLHLGDVSSAQEAFKRHLEYSPTGGVHDPVQGLLHSAFIASAQNDFNTATQILQQAHKIAPDNALVINNLSVCLMFVGQIREAVQTVESAVLSRPETFLHEALLLNLATMYELESSSAHRKKLKLLALVSAHKGDGFNIAALKLQV